MPPAVPRRASPSEGRLSWEISSRFRFFVPMQLEAFMLLPSGPPQIDGHSTLQDVSLTRPAKWHPVATGVKYVNTSAKTPYEAEQCCLASAMLSGRIKHDGSTSPEEPCHLKFYYQQNG
ncbi:jg23778 [Pararge aegeria aegeria]|uniref:Jg23778 protein n=1 Tax=Pararge aegeria aegeria TaxID=348720 RepID=A0A8S4SP98_9NEOP|nr:jg23778 [Pararge aegeria aegeria]